MESLRRHIRCGGELEFRAGQITALLTGWLTAERLVAVEGGVWQIIGLIHQARSGWYRVDGILGQ
jgi:hypothetical protein